MVRHRRHRLDPSRLAPPRPSRAARAPHGRVLIVDADPDTRQRLTMILTTEGYDVDAAGDGESAMTSHRTRPADVILIDLDSPGTSGQALVRELAGQFPEVVVVTMSADTEAHWRAVQAEARTLGARLTLRKPLEPWVLLRTLEGLAAVRKSLLGGQLHRSA
jgi:DNA-binding response OmpR family regulator